MPGAQVQRQIGGCSFCHVNYKLMQKKHTQRSRELFGLQIKGTESTKRKESPSDPQVRAGRKQAKKRTQLQTLAVSYGQRANHGRLYFFLQVWTLPIRWGLRPSTLNPDGLSNGRKGEEKELEVPQGRVLSCSLKGPGTQ